jgi:hypothetical protein
MPKAAPVTFEGYSSLQFKLESKGFREATESQKLRFLAQMRKCDPAALRCPPRGGETCFFYVHGKYIVVIWTSCLLREIRRCRWQMDHCAPDELPFHLGTVVSRPPNEDAARILILEVLKDQPDEPRYFARYVNRTKGFVNNVCKRAWIAAYKISHRPVCEKCGAKMDICRNKEGGSYWSCFNKAHPIPEGEKASKPFFRNWHCVLPPKAKKIAEAEDRDFAKDLKERRDKAKKAGKKPPERAFRIRAMANAKRMMEG